MRPRLTAILGLLTAYLVAGCGEDSGNTSLFRGDTAGASSAPAGGSSGAISAGGQGSTSSNAAANAGGGADAAGSVGALPACEPTTQWIQDMLIVPSCTARVCHGAGAPAAALDLSTMNWSVNVLGVSASTCDGWARVVPGSPERSFLYEKIAKDVPACDGDRMPGGDPLPEQYIGCVAEWITGLSPNGCETCGGADCVSLPSDRDNCGACGNVCPAASTCQSGECVCPGTQLACGASCVDTSADATHCGGCDDPCPAGAACNGGQCACSGSLTMCGAICTDLGSDAANCGACGKACASDQVCSNGACGAGCGALTQCGSSCIDLTTSTVHCGSCGNACAAGLACANGACGCAPAQALCEGKCVDLKSDADHCGSCGAACGPGSTCAEGACRCGSTTVSFASDVQPIFTASCNDAGCHSGARPKEGLSLEPSKAHAALVGVASSQCDSRKLVTPGNVAQSYLMDKLLGVALCSGSQMPKAGQGLHAAQLSQISDWICQGAHAN